MKKEFIIDIQYGNIYGEGNGETVILKGDYLYENNNYVENLVISIKDENDNIEEYKIKANGYNFKVFIGKFSSSDSDDIYIYGKKDKSGENLVNIIYKYNKGKLIELFNGENFSSNIIKVDLIYDLENQLINLLVYEKILENNNSKAFNKTNTLISLKNNKINVIDKYSTVSDKSILNKIEENNIKAKILDKLPKDATFISFDKFGGNNELIIKDIDGDGIDEIICGYVSKKVQYISVFREKGGKINLLDTILGEGYDISDLIIEKLNPRSRNNIIIGWKVASIWSHLDILEFKENKFNRLLKGSSINYSKIDIVKFEDRKNKSVNIALWSHETGEAYSIQIYSFKGDNLEKTSKYDRNYFEKVEEYYKKLIDRTRETPKYLYYLIDAECKSGKKKEAIENINKALQHSNPYPSIEELKRLRKRI